MGSDSDFLFLIMERFVRVWSYLSMQAHSRVCMMVSNSKQRRPLAFDDVNREVTAQKSTSLDLQNTVVLTPEYVVLFPSSCAW